MVFFLYYTSSYVLSLECLANVTSSLSRTFHESEMRIIELAWGIVRMQQTNVAKNDDVLAIALVTVEIRKTKTYG